MIQDVGNIELCQLLETEPKTQCKACLSYWSEGIVYCRLLKEIAANRGVIEYTLDLLSTPEYIIKKGRLHGHRYGKTPEKKEYHLAHNLKKRCIKKNFKKIHDRFLRNPQPCSKMTEMEKFVSNGTILQTKISLITWRNQNIFDTNIIGGSLTISLETLDHWEIVLTSTKHCLH